MDHHAYVYEADGLAAANVPELVRTASIDVDHIHCDRFSIDDARRLKAQAETRPVANPTRNFVIVARSFTIEAQNALLKLFEEPPAQAVFHVIVPQVTVLLPTLRSRVQLAQRARTSDSVHNPTFSFFLDASLGERLERVAQLVKDKDIHEQEQLLRDMERYAHSGLPETQAFLKDIVVARTYLESPGASRKMIFESLALALGTQSR